MDKKDLFYLLDGFYAKYEAQTNGIVDYQKHDEVQAYLNSLNQDEFRVLMNEYIREYMVGEEATKLGYGIEDVKGFIEFLDKDFNIYV